MDSSAASNQKFYDQLACVYDALTADYDHETWLRRLHVLAGEHGNGGRRLLDVACGTGSSFLPLLGHGYDVTACDVSGGMTAVARRRAEGRARVWTEDMCRVPELGSFDVVTCLDDAVNHLVERRELIEAFRSMARCLAPDGVLVFDANTLLMYRTSWASEARFARDETEFTWRGLTPADARPGAIARVAIEARMADGGRFEIAHESRHYTLDQIRDCLAAAGLRPLAVLGQTTGAVLHRGPRELDHSKTVLIVGRA